MGFVFILKTVKVKLFYYILLLCILVCNNKVIEILFKVLDFFLLYYHGFMKYVIKIILNNNMAPKQKKY